MTTKLNKTESRALEYCERIKERGVGSFTIEWKKSQMWGHNPTIQNYSGERMVSVSGCGYCKHSTALADLLCFLGAPNGERNEIRGKGGCGVQPVIDELLRHGWILKSVHWTKSSDTYSLEKIN